MIALDKDVAALTRLPTKERLQALKRIIPKARVQDILRHTGHAECRTPFAP